MCISLHLLYPSMLPLNNIYNCYNQYYIKTVMYLNSWLQIIQYRYPLTISHTMKHYVSLSTKHYSVGADTCCESRSTLHCNSRIIPCLSSTAGGVRPWLNSQQLRLCGSNKIWPYYWRIQEINDVLWCKLA